MSEKIPNINWLEEFIIPIEAKNNISEFSTNVDLLLLSKNMVSRRIIFYRHLDYDKNTWELLETWREKWEKEAKKINDFIWEWKYSLMYSGDTARSQQTADIFESKISFTEKLNNIYWLRSRNKNSDNIWLSSSEIAFKSMELFRDLIQENKDVVCIAHKSNIGPFLDFLNNKEGNRLIEYSALQPGESYIVDINNSWDIIDYNQNTFLQLNIKNFKKIVQILKKDDVLWEVIEKYKKQKIDSKYLQNSINYYFEKYDLYEKYLFSDNLDLSNFCLKNLLKNNKLSTEKIELMLEKRSLEDLKSFFEIIKNNSIVLNSVFEILKNKVLQNTALFKIFNNNFELKEHFLKDNLKDFFFAFVLENDSDINEVLNELDRILNIQQDKIYKKLRANLSNILLENEDRLDFLYQQFYLNLNFSIFDSDIVWYLEEFILRVEKNIYAKIDDKEYLYKYENNDDLIFKIKEDENTKFLEMIIYFVNNQAIKSDLISDKIEKIKNAYLIEERSQTELKRSYLSSNKSEKIADIELQEIYENKLDNIWNDFFKVWENWKEQNPEKNAYDIDLQQELVPILRKYEIKEKYYELLIYSIDNKMYEFVEDMMRSYFKNKI